MTAPSPLTFVFAIFPGVTQLDFTGPYEVFCRLPEVTVVVASSTGGNVVSEHGLVFDTVSLAKIERCDLICVPGGPGQTQAMDDQALMDAIRRLGLQARWLTSVCSGSLMLGAAGLITGRRAACHWAYRDLLAEAGAIPVAERVVRDGDLITGGGITSGIDFALAVAAEVAGPQTAQAIQLMLEYAPVPPFESGLPETAPLQVLALVKARIRSAVEARGAAMRRAIGRLAVQP